jgi:hypothetical protein
LEEVSGFVVVTKQNYFKPIRKNEQEKQCRKYSAEEQKGMDHYSQRNKDDNEQQITSRETTRIYFDSQERKEDKGGEQSEYNTEQKLSKLSGMRTKTEEDDTSKSMVTFPEKRIPLRVECGEKGKERARIRSNQSDDAASRSYIDEGLHSKVSQSISQTTQAMGNRNLNEERERDNLSYREEKEMQTLAEGYVKEFFPSIKNSQVSLEVSNSSSNDHTRRRYTRMCDLESTTDLKRLEKIEAIEGWINLYESEFSNERNKAIRNTINNTEVKKVIKNNATLGMQESQKGALYSILSGGTSKSMDTAKVQRSTALLPNYVDIIGAKQRESLTQRATEYSGLHPRIEKVNNSASTKRSQHELHSLKYISAETLEETEYNQQTFRTTGKETSIPNTSAKTYETRDESVNIEGTQEGFFGPITNTITGNGFLENISLRPSSILQNKNYYSRKNNSNKGEIVVEPICQVVRLAQQQNEQFMARSEFKKPSTSGGNSATLEQIEAMIEPKLEEHSVNEHNVKGCTSRKTGTKTEPSRRSSFHSLMPDIVQVKLGIDNQSKILDKLDKMMKHSGIVDPNRCETKPTKAASVQCSEEILVTGGNTDNAIGKAELISCAPLSFPSDNFHSKIESKCENSKISDNNESQSQNTVNTACSNVSVFKQMSGGRIIERNTQASLPCPSLQKFPKGQKDVFGYPTPNFYPIGEYQMSISQLLSLINIYFRVYSKVVIQL